MKLAISTCTRPVRTHYLLEVNQMDSFMTLSWGSPVGLGVFRIGAGVFFWGLAKAGWTGKK